MPQEDQGAPWPTNFSSRRRQASPAPDPVLPRPDPAPRTSFPPILAFPVPNLVRPHRSLSRPWSAAALFELPARSERASERTARVGSSLTWANSRVRLAPAQRQADPPQHASAQLHRPTWAWPNESSESVQCVRIRSTTPVRLLHGFVLLLSGISSKMIISLDTTTIIAMLVVSFLSLCLAAYHLNVKPPNIAMKSL